MPIETSDVHSPGRRSGNPPRRLRKALGLSLATGYKFRTGYALWEVLAALYGIWFVCSFCFCCFNRWRWGSPVACLGYCAVNAALSPLEQPCKRLLRESDLTDENDARIHALDALKNVSESFKNMHPEWESKLKEIRTTIKQTLQDHKAVATVLYCQSSSNNCTAFYKEVQAMIKEKGRRAQCFHGMRFNGEAHEDNAGRTQLEIASVLQRCKRAVIVLDSLDHMSPGEMNVLHTATSEHGAYICNGRSIRTHDALYLLPWISKDSNAEARNLYTSEDATEADSANAARSNDDTEPAPKLRGDASLVPHVRDEVFTTVNNGKHAVDSEKLSAFRRRIDHVFPIIVN